jgi:glycosyltransferase involved in cell wall biosynthesis
VNGECDAKCRFGVSRRQFAERPGAARIGRRTIVRSNALVDGTVTVGAMHKGTTTASHIVIVAPPWYPVPPHGYGGIELVVGLLGDALVDAGHRVTMLAAEGSRGDATILAPRAWRDDLGGGDERLRELTYAARVARTLRDLGDVDVIHDHCGFGTLVAAYLTEVAPVVHTVHGDIPEAYSSFYTSVAEDAAFVAISGQQRRSMPELPWAATVYNAVDVASLHVALPMDKHDYLLCLARICPIKGQHLAIEVARRTGLRLVLAGKVEGTAQGVAYYEQHVAPAVDGDRVIHLHNVAGADKTRLLSRARALLAPIQWDEPFGLASVEAMASGTPAISMARGAAPELIVEGVSGFLVDDVDEMTTAVSLTPDIESKRCADVTRARFSPSAMARGYLSVYDDVVRDRTALHPWMEVPAAALTCVN